MAQNMTLLDLVKAVSEHAPSEAEVIATVVYLVNSGRVRLCVPPRRVIACNGDGDDANRHDARLQPARSGCVGHAGTTESST
jgi:hypothetical protein